jgi:hypothetical protein
MSEFSDAFDEVFTVLADTHEQRVTIVCGGVSKSGIFGPFVKTRELRDSGYREEATNTASLQRADFVALGIDDRSVLLIGTAQERCKVIRIEDDPADPIVLVHVRKERTS